jgi:hypothetical protein
MDAKLVGPPEGGLSVWAVMGFDDMDLKPWKKHRQTLMDYRRGFHVIDAHCARDEHRVLI